MPNPSDMTHPASIRIPTARVSRSMTDGLLPVRAASRRAHPLLELENEKDRHHQ